MPETIPVGLIVAFVEFELHVPPVGCAFKVIVEHIPTVFKPVIIGVGAPCLTITTTGLDAIEEPQLAVTTQ